jgi:membrane protein DedA with SNARE-associated domain
MFEGAALIKYFSIWGTIIASGFGLPVPEEIPVVTGGVLVGESHQVAVEAELKEQPVPPGEVFWWIMLPGTILAVVIGDSVLYFGGRWFGPRLMRNSWIQRKVLPPAQQAKIEENFKKRGVMILLAARFTPGVRMPVFLMAGVLRMPLSRFLLADGLYAIPGVNLLFWLGYFFTRQFLEALEAVERYRPMVIVAVLAAVGGIILYKLLANRKLSTGDMADVSGLAKPVGAVAHAIEQGIERVVDVVTHPLGHKPRPHSETDPKSGLIPPPPPAGDTPAPAK